MPTLEPIQVAWSHGTAKQCIHIGPIFHCSAANAITTRYSKHIFANLAGIQPGVSDKMLLATMEMCMHTVWMEELSSPPCLFRRIVCMVSNLFSLKKNWRVCVEWTAVEGGGTIAGKTNAKRRRIMLVIVDKYSVWSESRRFLMKMMMMLLLLLLLLSLLLLLCAWVLIASSSHD